MRGSVMAFPCVTLLQDRGTDLRRAFQTTAKEPAAIVEDVDVVVSVC